MVMLLLSNFLSNLPLLRSSCWQPGPVAAIAIIAEWSGHAMQQEQASVQA